MEKLINKTTRLEIRLTSFDKKLIKIKAQESGLSISEYVLLSALNRSIKPPLSEQEVEIYKSLKEYQTHFARLSNLIKNSSPSLNQEIKILISSLQKHLDFIYHGKQGQGN